MALFTELRALAYLKRAAIALEDIAESQRILASCVTMDHAPRPRPAKTVFESLDLAAAEKDWAARTRIEREEAGETVEEG